APHVARVEPHEPGGVTAGADDAALGGERREQQGREREVAEEVAAHGEFVAVGGEHPTTRRHDAARVVDECVQRAECGELLGGLAHGGEGGAVEAHVGELRVGRPRADRGDRELRLLARAGRDHDPGPGERELLGDEVADARVAAGHDDRAAVLGWERARVPALSRGHASPSSPEASRSWWWITSATTKVNHFSANSGSRCDSSASARRRAICTRSRSGSDGGMPLAALRRPTSWVALKRSASRWMS